MKEESGIPIEKFSALGPSTPKSKLTIRATVDLDITWCPEDFEGSELSWEQFVKKVQSDKHYATQTFMSNVQDFNLNDLVDLRKARISVIEGGE